MKYKIFTAAMIILSSVSIAQNKDEEKVNVTFGGYVRTDVVFDSRQNETTREGYFLRYPLKEDKDKNGDDLNAKSSLGLFSIHSRLSAKITGPSFLGAKPTGMVEADFFGPGETAVNSLRMRHFYMELKWSKSSLLFGQYWHPMVVAEMAPQTVSANSGSPFQAFARAPQIKYTQNFSDLALIFAVSSQRDNSNDGPSGSSPLYLKNSMIPELNMLVQYKAGNHLFGIGGNFRSIMPRLKTVKNISTDERVNSYLGIAYMKLAFSDFVFAAKGLYGQNANHLSMLGAYAVESVDTATGHETYTNLNTASAWADLSYGKDVKVGLFAGYTKNLGAEDNTTGTIYGRGKDIDNLLRVAPRITWNISKARLAGEFEYTAAAYGKPDKKAKVQNTTTVSNLRLLVSAYYFF